MRSGAAYTREVKIFGMPAGAESGQDERADEAEFGQLQAMSEEICTAIDNLGF
jgi:hypothetical protein